MQSSFVTDAINLKSYNLSESDKIIVMYSKDKGLIKGVAKGVKKPKSKLGARMDVLVANKVMLHSGKNLATICQADALNMFNNTRADLDKIFYSMYMTEIVNNFGIEDDPASSDIYELLYNALEFVSAAQTKIQLLLAVIKFQLKMMKYSGFSVEFDDCLCCHSKIDNNDMYFVPELGGVVCCNCSRHVHYSKKVLNSKLRDFFKSMSEADFSDEGYYEKHANEKVCIVCFDALKEYITLKSPKRIKTVEILQ